MNKFNLTFSGEILAGHDPAQVKLRFGKVFAIDDPVRLERFFSGQTIILRRNLERKAAAQYYHELHLLGVAAALVKVTASEAADELLKAAPAPPDKTPEKSTRNKIDIAAQIKARKAESLRLSAEQAARDKAALQDQQRKAEEDKTRQKALRDEQKAEEARRKAELAAKRKAELEEIRRQEAEEAARLQAELAAKKLREAEESARIKAEQEEIERQEAEEAARLQAEIEEIKRQEAQEAARIKAEAQRREVEAQRQSAERRRAAAEQLAAQRAQRKEEKRLAAARQAEQKIQQAQAARQQATEVARLKAEQRRKKVLEQQEHEHLKEALQEKVVQRAATELAQSTGLKPTSDRVKTSLEVPQRRPPEAAGATPAPRKRQLGEPNLYTLRPFRNTDEVRARATDAHQRMRHGYTLGAIALAALLIAGGYLLRQAAPPVITGAAAIAIDLQSAPLLLAGDSLLFHNRAGVYTKEESLSVLGVSTMAGPMAFDSSGRLLALGRLLDDAAEATAGQGVQLLRCAPGPSTCEYFSPLLHNSNIDTFVIHPLDGSLLLADRAAGELLKINRAGQIVARAAATIPEQPVLRLHGGLLLMNGADGPAISVFRYEDNAFGQQLDEILLLPPAAQQAEQTKVGDFLWSSGTWWASLHNPASGSHGLYRFDEQWNYLNEVALPDTAGPPQLLSWGEKTLVNAPHQPAVQRFNAIGKAEAPFVSTQLEYLVARDERSANLTTVAWRAGLLLCALAALLGFGFGYLQNLRSLVYKPHRERGAEPVDAHVESLRWIDPVQHRLALLRSRGVSYALLVVGILLLAVAQSVTVGQLSALLLALSGPAIALLLLRRHPLGHIGILKDRLLLVDHSGMYHLASGSGIQYHGPFLAIDDVVVFTGSRLLPAFSSPQLQHLVRPLALGGVKVDRNTMVVKLLQCRHPLAQSACAILVATATAVMLLCLHGIF